MTEEHIKEELSRLFVTALATVKGIVISRPTMDYGVDYRIEIIEPYIAGEHNRFFSSGRIIDIQLKTTTSQAINRDEKGILFDLPVRNYNDLIQRRNNLAGLGSNIAPLILIVVFLPEKREEWLSQEKDKIELFAKGFWYYPSKDLTISLNLQSRRIWIPEENRVDLEFFDKAFNLQILK